MVKSKKITNVWLKRNPLGPNAADVLANLVIQTENLRTLDLENTELGDKGVSKFLHLLTGTAAPHRLRNLFLNANGLGEEASQALAAYLDSPNTQLESIFLGSNPIGDTGIKHLAPALRRHSTLQRLSLCSTALTPDGVNELCAALADHPSLTTLDLSRSMTTIPHGQRYNWITGDCVQALSAFLKSANLRFVTLGHIWLNQSELDTLEAAVVDSNLVHFDAMPVIVPGKPDSEFIAEAQTTSTAYTRNFSFLNIHKALESNVKTHYPQAGGYADFVKSHEFRFLRNTNDVRLIDSHYRTANKRDGVPNEQYWKDGDGVWKLVVEDAAKYDD
jgi:hypothetical protein